MKKLKERKVVDRKIFLIILSWGLIFLGVLLWVLQSKV